MISITVDVAEAYFASYALVKRFRYIIWITQNLFVYAKAATEMSRLQGSGKTRTNSGS